MKKIKLKGVFQAIAVIVLIACMIVPQNSATQNNDNSATPAEKIEPINIKPMIINSENEPVVIKDVIPKIMEPPAEIPAPPRDVTPM